MSVDFFSLRELVRWYDGHLGTGTLRRHWPGGDTYWNKYTQPVILVVCITLRQYILKTEEMILYHMSSLLRQSLSLQLPRTVI